MASKILAPVIPKVAVKLTKEQEQAAAQTERKMKDLQKKHAGLFSRMAASAAQVEDEDLE
jgi:hypothetical protein